jgi:hypothetical protein
LHDARTIAQRPKRHSTCSTPLNEHQSPAQSTSGQLSTPRSSTCRASQSQQVEKSQQSLASMHSSSTDPVVEPAVAVVVSPVVLAVAVVTGEVLAVVPALVTVWVVGAVAGLVSLEVEPPEEPALSLASAPPSSVPTAGPHPNRHQAKQTRFIARG